MKKIHLLHYLLLCYMVLAVATSCGDDEDDYAPDNVNDPEKLTDPLPTTDQLGVTHNNTLYYLSFWSKEDHMISENMINRYKEAVPYAPGKKMEVGDAFFFTRQDIDRIQSDTDLLADIKDMFHKRSIVMMMEGGTNEILIPSARCWIAIILMRRKMSLIRTNCRCGYFLDRFRRRADSIPSSMRSVLLPELMAKNLYRRLMNTGRDFIAT